MSEHEKNIALRNGHEIAQSEAYFLARPQIDTKDRRNVFEAGFNRGWESAQVAFTQLQAKIEELEKNDARFRWLVTQDGLYNKHRAVYSCFVEGFTEREMIAAIDAAMRETK